MGHPHCSFDAPLYGPASKPLAHTLSIVCLFSPLSPLASTSQRPRRRVHFFRSRCNYNPALWKKMHRKCDWAPIRRGEIGDGWMYIVEAHSERNEKLDEWEATRKNSERVIEREIWSRKRGEYVKSGRNREEVIERKGRWSRAGKGGGQLHTTNWYGGGEGQRDAGEWEIGQSALGAGTDKKLHPKKVLPSPYSSPLPHLSPLPPFPHSCSFPHALSFALAYIRITLSLSLSLPTPLTAKPRVYIIPVSQQYYGIYTLPLSPDVAMLDVGKRVSYAIHPHHWLFPLARRRATKIVPNGSPPGVACPAVAAGRGSVYGGWNLKRWR